MKCAICKLTEIEKQYDDKGFECILGQVDAKGKIYWEKGHNAEPVEKGRCCEECNLKVVIPTRLIYAGNSEHPIKETKARRLYLDRIVEVVDENAKKVLGEDWQEQAQNFKLKKTRPDLFKEEA